MNDPDWNLIFWPKDFAKRQDRMEYGKFRIGRDKLLELGGYVTLLRKNLRNRALEYEVQRAQDLDQDLMEISKLAKKIDKGYFPISHDLMRESHEEFVEENMIRFTSKKRKLKDLSI